MGLGALFAVLSAFTFALNGVSVRRGVLTGSVAQAMAITVPMGIPIFLGAALLTGSLDRVFAFSAGNTVLLALAGIIHFVWGRYCNYRATKAIGSNAMIPFREMNFPFTLALAIIFLSETLTTLKITGIILILVGGSIGVSGRIGKRGKGGKAKATKEKPIASSEETASDKPVFVPRYAEGYTFALLSITGYGMSPLFIRSALEDAGILASLAGGLISYTAATIVILLILLLPGRWSHVRAINPVSARWFVASSLFVGFSQMFRYMALSMAPITVVAPIMRAAGVFQVILNWFVNRHYESFDPRLLIGIAASLVGGIMVTLSADFVMALLPLPDSLAEVLHWAWP